MAAIGGFRSDLSLTLTLRLTEILETFPRVFCFPKSPINESGGKNTTGSPRSHLVVLCNVSWDCVCFLAPSPKLLQAWWQVILFAVSIANYQGEIVLIQIVSDVNLVDYSCIY